MITVSEQNFEHAFPPTLRDRYWRELEAIVSHVFEQPRSVVSDYRERLESRPAAEQILAFHHPPLSAALDLLGYEELSPEQEARLDRIEDHGYVPDRATRTPPPRWAVEVVFLTVPKTFRREALKTLLEEYYRRQEYDGVRASRAFMRSTALTSVAGLLPLSTVIAGIVAVILKFVM